LNALHANQQDFNLSHYCDVMSIFVNVTMATTLQPLLFLPTPSTGWCQFPSWSTLEGRLGLRSWIDLKNYLKTLNALATGTMVS
jgi:hypothetical protein